MKQVNSFRYWLATLLLLCVGMTAQAYDLTKTATAEDHGTITFKVNGTAVTSANEKDKVTIEIAPKANGWQVDQVTATRYTSWNVAGARGEMPTTADLIKVQPVTGSAFTYEIEEMPGYNVQVDVTYKKTSLNDNDKIKIAEIGEKVYKASAWEPEVTVTDETRGTAITLIKGTDYTVKYENNLNVGTAKVTITAVEGSGFEGSKETTFKIVPAEITSVTLVNNKLTYNAKEQTVSISKVFAGSLEVPVSDYDIVTGTDKGTNAGSYEAKVTGKNNFTGTKGAAWTIEKADLSNYTVVLEPSKFVYGGDDKQPAVTVKNGDKTVAASEYKVTYTNNKNAGTATVTVKGEEVNYTGTATKNFTIEKAPLKAVTLEKYSLPYKPTGNTVTITGVTAEGETGNSATKVTLTLTTNDWEVVSGKTGTNVGTYKLIVKGKGNFKDNAEAEWTIAKTAPSATKEPTPNTDLTYNGKDQDLVTPGETSDGTIQYSKDGGNTWTTTIPTGKDVGDYPVQWKIVGDDNHSDSDPKPLSPDPKIKPAKISSVTLVKDVLTFNGTEQSVQIASVIATVGEETLTLTSADYDVKSGQTAIDAGSYTLIVEGKGNFEGTAPANWTMKAASIEGAKVTLSPKEFIYNGNAQTPETVVVEKFGKTLVEGTDYTVAYEDNVNAGTAKAIITGKGNFDSNTSVTEPYTIKPAELQTVTLKNNKLTYIYNTEQTVEITSVTTKNGLTVAAANYTVSGNKGTDAKSYTLTVNAKANTNYTGSATVDWEIQKKSAKDFTVELDKKEFTYDGTAKFPNVTVKDGENVLTKDTDYTLEFKDNVKAGINTAKVIVTGIGNYTDKKEDVTFSILRANGEVKADPEQITMTYGMDPQTATVKIVSPTDLENYYFVSSDEAVATVDPETGVVTAQGAGVATIYVVVMADNNYESMYAVTQVIVKPVEIVDADVTEGTAGVNGIPTYTVQKFGKPLVEGEDYTLEFFDKNEVKQNAAYVVNNAGDYMAVLTFCGNYYGIVEKKFKATGLTVTSEIFIPLLLSGTSLGAEYDFNGDGEVNIADLQALLNLEVGLTPEGDPISSASRASVNAEDAVMSISTNDLGGGVTRYALSLEGNRAFSAFQMDVVTTGSMQVVGEQAASNEMTLRNGTLRNGSLRIIGFGTEQSGPVVYIDVMGEGSLSIGNICFSTQQATAFFVRQAGDATGISLTTAATAEGDIFGLGGQRQQTLQKGVNIVRGQNGKSVKVLRK